MQVKNKSKLSIFMHYVGVLTLVLPLDPFVPSSPGLPGIPGNPRGP